MFEFSTGRSWQEIATRYGALVDGRLGQGGGEALGGPAEPGESMKAMVARVVGADSGGTGTPGRAKRRTAGQSQWMRTTSCLRSIWRSNWSTTRGGERYGPGARLNDAAEIYRKAMKKGTNAVIQQNLLIALLRAGRYAEAATVYKPVLTIVTTALAQGSDRAILDSQSELPEATGRASALSSASLDLAMMRKYQLATSILKAAQRMGPDLEIENRLSSLRQMKPMEEERYKEDDPRAVVWRFFQQAYTGRFDRTHLAPLLAEDANGVPDHAEARLIRNEVARGRARFAGIGMNAQSFGELAMSLIESEKSGDEATG